MGGDGPLPLPRSASPAGGRGGLGALEDRRHAVLREFAELTSAVWLRSDDQADPTEEGPATDLVETCSTLRRRRQQLDA
ncbi:hypothetical protein E1161_00080 [Saccharopolyspora aridisoli]|uniref:Uncharacterized protein n=1 Tax=Saccharopolyspora aridisoli TaxID=2530385 RepID=A0A4R4V0Z3_9PSEU|nr:hypothetical protein [Saccharopolyspora aridisoli]TDC96676.1 hypothetical protein E1161_00080 [Saccharopolyspora aridisoli]